jgi:glycogen synthase
MYIYRVKTKRRNFNYAPYDALFTAKLDAWQPMRRGFVAAFGSGGADSLNARERSFRPASRKVAFLAFENSFAQLGGLAAVARILPACLSRAGEDVSVLTPLYANIPKVKEALANGTLEPAVPKQEFQSASYRGVVSCYRAAASPVPAYFIAVEGRFAAALNPYSYADSNDLLDDSLAFCAAAPFILSKLGIMGDVLFHAHDWETAPVALTSKIAVLDGLMESARTVLTLHNSFDSGIDAERKKIFFGGDIPGDTVLRCVLPLLDGPLTTVSAPFAGELRNDPLQRAIFTNHLQGEFAANPPIGVENGMFGKPRLRYTYTALSHARQGVYDKLLAEKARFREAMLRVVAAMAGREGVIGGLAEADRPVSIEKAGVDVSVDGRPVFFMSGRLDLMQKGFDVVFNAVQRFPPGKAALLFCPSSAEGVRHGRELAFFRGIAEERPGDIVIWPFRITEAEYAAVMLGSSFLLMPSFYEPFGAATEGFIHGTPVVARATGGLTAQVRPLAGGGAGPVGAATGLLYREAAEGDGPECAGWRGILDVSVEERIREPLYQSMVNEAFNALSVAASIFADKARYGRMMVNCMDSLRDFSWNTAAAKYRRVYDTAAYRGFFDD